VLSERNLLYLLADYAVVEAKIEISDNWRDPQLDSLKPGKLAYSVWNWGEAY